MEALLPIFPDVALTPPVMSQMCSNELNLNWMVFNTTTFIKGDVVVIFYNIELTVFRLVCLSVSPFSITFSKLFKPHQLF